MSEPPKKRPRITEDLNTLGRILHKPNTPKPRTPNASAGANKIFVRTPGSAAVTPGRTPTASARARRVGSARRGAPTTPHAIRALQQRRNAVLASGGNRRRRSGLMQRETPRNDLRALGRILNQKAKPPPPESREPTPRRRRSSLVDKDDSPALDRAPRLSMALGDLDDDSFHEAAPRHSYPFARDDEEDEIEIRRRAALRRSSINNTTFLDNSIVDLNDLAPGTYEDVTEQRQRLLDANDMSIRVEDLDEETAELRAMLEARRQSGAGDETELTDGEPTFLFRIPERSRLSLAQSVPGTPDGQVAVDEEEYEDVEDEEDAVARPEVGYYDEEDYDAPAQDAGSDLEDEPLRQTSVPLGDTMEVQARSATAVSTKAPYKRLPREVKLSRFGIEYPSLPPAVVKRMVNTFSKQYGGSGKFSKDTLASIQQASDWFFEQVSEDAADYATHAGRKVIEESDVVTLMKRQRLLNQNTTLFSLASKYLPRELLQQVRMPPQQIRGKKRKRTAKKLQVIAEEEEE